MYGTVLADGTFLPGSCAVVGNDLEITMSVDSAVQHMADLMDPQKTKIITFHVGNPVAVYEGYTKFLYMQPDAIEGKMDFWLTKEDRIYAEERNSENPDEESGNQAEETAGEESGTASEETAGESDKESPGEEAGSEDA